MRPVELVVEGFTCFRDRQDPLDFRSLDLFAITGPTGAGKSSVLDAISYALYCKVPRLGKRGVGDLISQLRDQVVVRFDFLMGGRQYRVTRRTRRRGQASAMLVELVDGGERPIADGVREVNQRVEAILGLSYDAFQQAVLLPQGEFDKFLRSDPGDRRDILRALLRLEVYEHMRERAHERARSLAAEIATARKRLEEDFAGVSDASVDALRRDLETAHADVSSRTETLANAEAELARLRPLHRATRDRCDAASRFDKLVKADPEIAQVKVRIARSGAAAAVMPTILAAAASNKRATAEASRAAEASAQEDRLRQGVRDASARLASARAAHEQVPGLHERLRVLDGAIAQLDHRDSLAARVSSLEDDRRAAEKALVDKQRSHGSLARQLSDAEKAHRAAIEAQAAIAYDGQRHVALESCRAAAAEVATLRERRGDRESEVARATKAARHAAANAAKANAEARRARAPLDELRGLHEAATRAYEHARNEHAAAHLRETLRPGAPCPVCEQPVQALPPGIVAPALEDARSNAEALERQRAEAQQAYDNAATAAATSQAIADRNADDQRAAEQALTAASDALASAVARLSADLTSAGITGDHRLPEAFVSETLALFVALRKKHDEADGTVRKAERALEDARRKLELAEREMAAGATRIADIDAALARDRAEFAQVGSRIVDACGTGDPAAERSAVAARIDALSRDLASAVAAAHEAERNLEAARAAATEAQRVATDAAAQAEREAATSRQAVTDAGFATEDEARAALLDDKELRSLVERVEAHERERTRLQDRIDELSRLLVDGEVSDAQMSAAERTAADARTARDTAVTRAASLRQRLDTDEQRLATARRLRTNIGTDSAEHAVAERLATDLKSDAFQEYLLQEVFERLVRDASVRLRTLTNRYTLEWDDGDFVVVDHDNAGERRAAQTLSGGETFLTSLSLALALSEQVQRTAGAVGLDSLFIDEGFGTLDADTLDIATEAIESLQVGGRMVGIISHIKDLTERMPACIVIDKRPDGSRWSVARS